MDNLAWKKFVCYSKLRHVSVKAENNSSSGQMACYLEFIEITMKLNSPTVYCLGICTVSIISIGQIKESCSYRLPLPQLSICSVPYTSSLIVQPHDLVSDLTLFKRNHRFLKIMYNVNTVHVF